VTCSPDALPEGAAVTRTTCHAGPEDFEGERCPGCGTNVYDWLLDGAPRSPLAEPAVIGHAGGGTGE
jgi:hypothetical protein